MSNDRRESPTAPLSDATKQAGVADEGTKVFVLSDDPEMWDAPAVVMLNMPAGYRLFRHAHVCHRFEVIVTGSLEVGGQILGPGAVMTARPGEMYGPHVAGPEGCVTAEVFGTHEGVYRVIAEGPTGIREYDFRKGETPEDYQPLTY
jgi:hypothetical protein